MGLTRLAREDCGDQYEHGSHQRFFGHCTVANGKIVLLREALNVLAAADGMFPGGSADHINKK